MKPRHGKRRSVPPPGRVSEPPVETTVFRSGNSDAVRLPRRLGMHGARVLVRPLGEGRLLIETKKRRRWPAGFFESFGNVTPDLEAPARPPGGRNADDAAARMFDSE